MSEKPKHSLGAEEIVRTQYKDEYGTFNLPLMLRRDAERYAATSYDMQSDVIKRLALKGEETVVDVGCANAEVLHKIRQQYRHKGMLIGIDIDENLFTDPLEELIVKDTFEHFQSNNIQETSKNVGDKDEQSEVKKSKEEEVIDSNIYYVVGNAEQLPLKEDSVDRLLALFMLYHVPNVEQALSEFQRVVQPGGNIAITTSSKWNKQRRHYFQKRIAEYLQPFGVSPPERFTKHFDTDIADQLLPLYFPSVEKGQYIDKLIIKDNEAVEAYINGLHSLKNSFYPPPIASQWQEAIEKCVRPEIEQEIEARGQFIDNLQQNFYICYNS